MNPLARLRSPFYVLLLFTVLATLVPAQLTSAQLNPIIKLDRQKVRGYIYSWWANYQAALNEGQGKSYVEWGVPKILVADHLLFDREGRYGADEVFKQLEALEKRYYERLGPRGADPAYRATLPPRMLGEAYFAAALENPIFKDSARRAYLELKHEAELMVEGARASAPVNPQYKTFLEGNILEEASRTVLQEKLDQAQERAEASPAFAGTWDRHFAPGIGLTLNFDTRDFFIANPGIPFPQEIRNSIKSDGSLEISLNTLQELARKEFASLHSSIDDMQKTLGEISRQQGELVNYVRDEQKRRADEAKKKAAQEKHQLRIQAANASVTIISSLIGLADPKAGKQTATVGTALVTVADSLYKWLDVMTGKGGLNELGVLSTAVMTGNILTAVLSVVSLFGESQPTPEQMILEEIGKLRQQIGELRTEMHDRFDRVDAQLNTIYTTMQERFNQIDIQLGKINGRLDEIQESLMSLGVAIDRLERNNFEYLDALGRRPMREAMNGALGYRQRTGLEMPYRPEFVNYENTFYSWATDFAFDSLSAGPTQRDYSDAAVLRELNSAPLDANLNYLNGWLVARGLPPISDKRLPGLRDWTFASRAYTELGFEWPEHFVRIGAERQATLDAIGKDLEQALLNITTIQTPDGPQGNAPLFTALTTNYHTKLAALDAALQANEQEFVKQVQGALERPVPFDLFGGMDQLLGQAYWPAEFMAIKCGLGNQGSLPAPGYLDYALSGYNRFALAEYLKIRPLKVCLELVWAGEFEHCPSPQNCEQRGYPQVTLKVFSNNVELLRHTVLGYVEEIKDIGAVVQRDWYTYYRPRFDGAFSSKPPAPLSPAGEAELKAVSEALASKLAEYQRLYAGQVLNELDGTGSLQARAVELGGAKKLLESFVSLGFAQATDGDDFLRSLLFSEEALVDDEQVRQIYRELATSEPKTSAEAPSEDDLLNNPRTGLMSDGAKRREALSSLLTDYLSGISTENYQEDIAIIAGTRFELEMARAFAEASNNAVFLPLLRR
jgi:hypothetical protein